MKFALVDCNNFYCSCERVFRPDLFKRPVAVLSNNDGCLVSRSDEVKRLGIQMGEPYFKVRPALNAHGVEVFSSNYALYADLSRRVMATLETFTPELEIYSIDEAFLAFSATEAAPEMAAAIRQRVWQWCRIPVSVGLGPTKTLAKLAAYWAKKHPASASIFELGPDDHHVFAQLEAATVWGIGARSASRLKAKAIYTVEDFIRCEPALLQRHFSISEIRTQLELKGQVCNPFEQARGPRKSVVCSRSFGHQVAQLWELREATAMHAATAGVKLRREGLAAASLTVVAQVLPGGPHEPGFKALSLNFAEPTSYTPHLIAAATALIEQIFTPGAAYKKVGVQLGGLTADDCVQLNLFTDCGDSSRQSSLMSSLDRINQRHGRDVLHYAACGLRRGWEMKRQLKSPHYTTCWSELPLVSAK